MKCSKNKHRSKALAQVAARMVCRSKLDASRVSAYRCHVCRFPDGQRAWHWGHLPGGRKR